MELSYLLPLSLLTGEKSHLPGLLSVSLELVTCSGQHSKLLHSPSHKPPFTHPTPSKTVRGEDSSPSPPLHVCLNSRLSQASYPVHSASPLQNPTANSSSSTVKGALATVCSPATFPNYKEKENQRESYPPHISSSTNTIK